MDPARVNTTKVLAELLLLLLLCLPLSAAFYLPQAWRAQSNSPN